MGADLLADLKEQREKSGPCQVANYTLRGGLHFIVHIIAFALVFIFLFFSVHHVLVSDDEAQPSAAEASGTPCFA
jgi:hypothetical protein